jgi:hypothetical protein
MVSWPDPSPCLTNSRVGQAGVAGRPGDLDPMLVKSKGKADTLSKSAGDRTEDCPAPIVTTIPWWLGLPPVTFKLATPRGTQPSKINFAFNDINELFSDVCT